MNLTQKTQKWVNENLISSDQQKKILQYETDQRSPFFFLGMMWLGIFCVGLGIISVIAAHWMMIPEGVKLGVAGLLLAGCLLSTYLFFQKEKRLLAEVSLFFAFLMIGGGIGLIAQIFNLPVYSTEGLLLWALVSLSVVLISQRSLLGLLWVPLFVGGLLGYLKLELLLFFFEQTPLLATVAIAGFFGVLALIADKFSTPFMKAVYHWSLILFFVTLALGDFHARTTISGFFTTVLLLGLMEFFAVYYHKVKLFNWTSFFVAVRFLVLYFQLFDNLTMTGLSFIVSGIVLLVIIFIWYKGKQIFFKKESKKP